MLKIFNITIVHFEVNKDFKLRATHWNQSCQNEFSKHGWKEGKKRRKSEEQEEYRDGRESALAVCACVCMRDVMRWASSHGPQVTPGKGVKRRHFLQEEYQQKFLFYWLRNDQMEKNKLS